MKKLTQSSLSDCDVVKTFHPSLLTANLYS